MPSLFQLSYFDPPPELARHVLALFHFAWDEENIADRHPGALGQLVLFPCGTGTISIGDELRPVEGEAHLFAGFETAAPYTMDGPWHAIGASLSPLGWAALTQSPANHHFDRFVDPATLLGRDIDAFAKETNDLYRAEKIDGEQGCERLAQWIAPRLKSVPRDHERLIETTVAWLGSALNPEAEALFAQLSYSRRQSERLVARYFGLSPMALARKYRAVRAASLLAQPALTDEGEFEIAMAFFDQSHMIREIRRFCGHTPTRLGGSGEPLFETMLAMKNLDRLQSFRSPS